MRLPSGDRGSAPPLLCAARPAPLLRHLPIPLRRRAARQRHLRILQLHHYPHRLILRRPRHLTFLHPRPLLPAEAQHMHQPAFRIHHRRRRTALRHLRQHLHILFRRPHPVIQDRLLNQAPLAILHPAHPPYRRRRPIHLPICRHHLRHRGHRHRPKHPRDLHHRRKPRPLLSFQRRHLLTHQLPHQQLHSSILQQLRRSRLCERLRITCPQRRLCRTEVLHILPRKPPHPLAQSPHLHILP